MAIRHYLNMTDKTSGKSVFSTQILDNNGYFDDEFYKKFNIKLDENYSFDETEVDLFDLTYEWHNFLQRHPNMLGLQVVNDNYRFNKDFKKDLFFFYATADSYELQLFRTMEKIATILMDNGVIVFPYEKFTFTLECF